MRSKPEFNYPAFMDGARRLREKGWTVFNPAEMDIKEDAPGDDFLTMSIEEQESHAGKPENARRYAWRDVKVIIGELKYENGDAIVVLPDWEESTGAIAETAVAKWCGLPRLTLEEALNV
jgi:hypothetical protein